MGIFKLGKLNAVDNLKVATLNDHLNIHCHNETRYFILVLTIICLAWLMGNSLILNFTIICMSDDEMEHNSSSKSFSHATEVGKAVLVDASKQKYGPSERSWLFSAVAIGSIVGTYPVVWLEPRMTIRSLFTLFGMLSGLSTILVPVAAETHFWLLFLMRFLQGFALAVSYPVTGSIATNWSTLEQSGMYTAWLSVNLQLGCIITLPIAGAFCVSPYGWQGVYYLLGIVTIVCYAIFYVIFRDSPRIHWYASRTTITCSKCFLYFI
ncbi:hypothetical protein AB6A40_001777 [Gnathostoma spinigerum]|uniref:Major facilitator superfamily (MFS) profile domain-containing protein n=1 Tax=Gnathostoma spinigerum TaxID=75299 RepID=A0ABD6E4Y9_9BILA